MNLEELGVRLWLLVVGVAFIAINLLGVWVFFAGVKSVWNSLFG